MRVVLCLLLAGVCAFMTLFAEDREQEPWGTIQIKGFFALLTFLFVGGVVA